MSDGGIIGGIGDGLKDIVSEGAKQLASVPSTIVTQVPKQIIVSPESAQEEAARQQQLASARARLAQINSLEVPASPTPQTTGPQVGEENPTLQPFNTQSLHQPNIIKDRAMTKRETKAGNGIGG